MASLDVSSDSDLEYAIADDLMQDVTERRRRQVLVITNIFYTSYINLIIFPIASLDTLTCKILLATKHVVLSLNFLGGIYVWKIQLQCNNNLKGTSTKQQMYLVPK